MKQYKPSRYNPLVSMKDTVAILGLEMLAYGIRFFDSIPYWRKGMHVEADLENGSIFTVKQRLPPVKKVCKSLDLSDRCLEESDASPIIDSHTTSR